MEYPESLALTPADRTSALWMKLKAHYTAKLQTLRTRNDSAMEEDKRNKLLGQIAEIKEILSLDPEKVVS